MRNHRAGRSRALHEAAAPQGSAFSGFGAGAGVRRGSSETWYPPGFRPWGRSLVLVSLLEDITVTNLRTRMIEDMKLAGLSPGTQDAYVRVVRQLAAHFGLSPDRLTERQLRDYLMHLREVRNVAKGTFQTHFFGIKFLVYEQCLTSKEVAFLNIAQLYLISIELQNSSNTKDIWSLF